MSATLSHAPMSGRSAPGGLRFGHESAADAASGREWSAEWLLKRNCSLRPSQLVGFFASLCVVSLGIGTVCWLQGAPLVMPFAGIELAAVATAFLLYARHA